MASLGESSALPWPWGWKPDLAQAPGPQWGEKEPRELLLFTRGRHCSLPGSALNTYYKIRVVRPPPYTLQRMSAGQRLAWRWETQSAWRGFCGPAHALPETLCLALR